MSDNSPVKFPFTISKQDEGLYRCTADNGISNSNSRDVSITVQCESRKRFTLFFIKLFMIDLFIIALSSLILSQFEGLGIKL